MPFDIMGIRIPTISQDNIATRCRGCGEPINEVGTLPFRVSVMDVVATEIPAAWSSSTPINPGPYQFHHDPACVRAWMRDARPPLLPARDRPRADAPGRRPGGGAPLGALRRHPP